MKENKKNREWIKNVAIVFLIIMLLLTFFSSTIMNYSLPEVATQYIEPGTVTAKIRGTGIVESGDPYSVKIKEVREVESIEVHVGDKVQEGDIICLLTADDSQELENAKDVLEQKQKAYDTAMEQFQLQLLTGDYDLSIMQNAGQVDSVKNYMDQVVKLKTQIEACEKEETAAEAKVNEWRTKIENLEYQIRVTNTAAAQVALNEARTADEAADTALTIAEKDLNGAKSQLQKIVDQIDVFQTVSSGDAQAVETLASMEAQKAAAQQVVDEKQAAYDTAAAAKEDTEFAVVLAQKNLDKVSRDNDSLINNLNQQITVANNEKAKADLVLSQKQTATSEKKSELSTLTKNISDAYGLSSSYESIDYAEKELNKAKEEVKKLQDKVLGCEVKAPISGTITELFIKSGLDTPQDGVVCTMQPEGKGYTMSFSVTNEQAKKVSVGDMAELVNSWRYDDIQVTLASIKPDPTNPGQSKKLTFNVTGESVVANQSLAISIGQKSANYDMIVPNSAIHEDNNGKFILIVESKSSPIGNRYFATRVDVEVLASDDTKSAISGGVYGYEFVITTSTKPVEAGKQVRLPD